MGDNIDKVLSEPIMPELSDTERRIKNNLIAFSVVAIFMCFWGLSISDDSSILGLKFKGLDQYKIYIGLLFFIFYSAIHYLWHVHDIFVEWRLRLTAISESRPLRFDGILPDQNLDNYRNNTLYHWWNYTKKYVANLEKLEDALIRSVSSFEEKLSEEREHGVHKFAFDKVSSGYLEELKSSRSEISKLIDMLNLPPFTEALPKFNNSFRYFLVSQNIRWVIFECIIPFGLAILAIYFICSKLLVE